jgi:hypothetical protein
MGRALEFSESSPLHIAMLDLLLVPLGTGCGRQWPPVELAAILFATSGWMLFRFAFVRNNNFYWMALYLGCRGGRRACLNFASWLESPKC